VSMCGWGESIYVGFVGWGVVGGGGGGGWGNKRVNKPHPFGPLGKKSSLNFFNKINLKQ